MLSLVGSHTRRALAIAGQVAALAVVLASSACSSQGSGAATGATPAPATTAPTTSPASATSATPPSGSATAGVRTCQAPDLSTSFGQQTGVDGSIPDQYELQVIMRNISNSACGMYGFPGVDMIGSGPTRTVDYPMPRSQATPSTVIVQPGAQSSFTLTYIAENTQEANAEDGAWGPMSIEVTPPNTTSHVTVPWPQADGFALQPDSGYASANEYISPVGQ